MFVLAYELFNNRTATKAVLLLVAVNTSRRRVILNLVEMGWNPMKSRLVYSTYLSLDYLKITVPNVIWELFYHHASNEL